MLKFRFDRRITAEYPAIIVFLLRHRLKNEAYNNTGHSYAKKWPVLRNIVPKIPTSSPCNPVSFSDGLLFMCPMCGF